MTTGGSLSEREWRDRALPAQERVFARVDAYERPFRDRVPARGLLFPLGYELDEGQLTVLRSAAAAAGDESFFLELLAFGEDDPRYWEFPLDASPYSPDGPIDFLLENVIFSPSGSWGLLISDEDHGVIAGVPEFMDVITSSFPPTAYPAQHLWGPQWSVLDAEWPEAVEDRVRFLVERSEPIPMRVGDPLGDKQVVAFIEFWKQFRTPERDQRWLPDLLAHVYGGVEAERLLTLGRW